MAIVNRDLDQSQQRDTYSVLITGSASGVSAGIMNPEVATGLTFPLVTIPSPGQLIAAETAVWGLSGTPVHSLWIYRFAGGFTSIAIGQTLTLTAYGTSGALAFSLFAAATYLLEAGDQIALYTQGSGAAVNSANVTLVVKNLQDIRTSFGV